MRAAAQKIAEEKIKPVRAEYDEKGVFPRDIIKSLAEEELYGSFIPEEYGGRGEGIFSVALITEQLARACGGIALAYSVNAFATTPIILFGSEEQKRKYLPDLASAKKIAAFSITEKDAGSDASAVKATAIKDGDHYVLNGRKQWIINAGEAEVYVVIFIVDPQRGARSATAFVVDKDTPGFTFGPKDNKMGIRASTTRDLIFEDCRIHESQMLGKVGQGFRVAMKSFDFASRPGMSAQALGIAQGAMDEAVAYSQKRVQFDKKISSFQAIQVMLADNAGRIEAARLLLYHLCRLIDKGEQKVTKLASMSKVLCSDAAMSATTDAVQIFGGYGYMKEFPVEKMMRDAKITQIYDGTNQIQRFVIATELTKEYARKSS